MIDYSATVNTILAELPSPSTMVRAFRPGQVEPEATQTFARDGRSVSGLSNQALEEYPEARELILEEFDLPAEKTTFEYAIHWDIGQKWRGVQLFSKMLLRFF